MALEPEVIFIAPELEQVVIVLPASAVGSALIVSVLVAVTSLQEVFP